MLRELWKEKKCTLPDLLEGLPKWDKDKPKTWLKDTSAARTADRATGSVLFMPAQAANDIQFLRVPAEGGKNFAFSYFIVGIDERKGAKPGLLVPRKASTFADQKRVEWGERGE